MKPMPSDRLDPKVKVVWRINDAIWITLVAVVLLASLALLASFYDAFQLWFIICAIIMVVLYGLFLVILPPIRYARWRYEITPEYLDIAKGIIWRKRYTIPFIRVQNTDTTQGPILRAFGLASVTVATAAQEHEIPGLDFGVAEALRDKAAEFARLAREDV